MDRIELGKELNLKEELIAEGRDNRPKKIIKPTSVTLHNTDNSNPGADADAHSKFVRNTGYYVYNGKKKQVSWHFTVDDTQVIKQLPLNGMAYHAEAANFSSLAVEICMHAGIDQAAANERAAKLVAVLLYDFGFDISAIKTHKDWTNKNCPSLLLSGLAAFKTRVQSILDSITGPKAGLEFDAVDLGLASDDEGHALFAPDLALLEAKDGGEEEDHDHGAIAEMMDARFLAPPIVPSGEERIRKAVALVKEGRVFDDGCSEFVSEVLGITQEVANSLMGANPTELAARPPYTGLAKGDIVGWKSSTGSGHVAIYFGKSDAEFFIDVRGEGFKPRIKNGYYDRMLYKSSRF